MTHYSTPVMVTTHKPKREKMSLSLLIRMEDEMESYRDGIYNQLKLLLKRPNKDLSTAIKKEIHAHLTNFNFGETWMEDGEYLIQRAHADTAARLREEGDDDFLYMVDDDTFVDTLFEAINRLDEVVELWESRLEKKAARRQQARY